MNHEQRINKLQQEQRNIKATINKYKAKQSQWFRKQNQKALIILDIILICCFLLNIGALAITKALVIKNNPTKQLVEANPVTANTYQLQTNNEANYRFMGFYIHALLWVFLIGLYIYKRQTTKTNIELYNLIFTVLGWLVILALDFFNDFGYLIGKLIFT